MAVFFLVTQYNSSLSSFVPNFTILSQVVAEKSLTEKSSLERKTNEQIEELISNIWLLFCYTIQIITIKLCTKFQKKSQVVAEKSLTEKQLKFSSGRKKNEK